MALLPANSNKLIPRRFTAKAKKQVKKRLVLEAKPTIGPPAARWKCKHGCVLDNPVWWCPYCVTGKEPPEGCVNPREDDPGWPKIQIEFEKILGMATSQQDLAGPPPTRPSR